MFGNKMITKEHLKRNLFEKDSAKRNSSRIASKVSNNVRPTNRQLLHLKNLNENVIGALLDGDNDNDLRSADEENDSVIKQNKNTDELHVSGLKAINRQSSATPNIFDDSVLLGYGRKESSSKEVSDSLSPVQTCHTNEDENVKKKNDPTQQADALASEEIRDVPGSSKDTNDVALFDNMAGSDSEKDPPTSNLHEKEDISQDENTRAHSTDQGVKKCSTCTVICKELKALISRLESNHSSLDQNESMNSCASFNKVEDNNEMVYLIKGSKVKVPLTKKHNLSLKIKSGDPQDYVNELMEIFFSNDTMVNMTYSGRTKGSVKMDPDIADAIMAYTDKKYDKKTFNFDVKLFKDFVNNKCYAIRHKLWNLKQSDPSIKVRSPMKKKKKNPTPNDDGKNSSSKEKQKRGNITRGETRNVLKESSLKGGGGIGHGRKEEEVGNISISSNKEISSKQNKKKKLPETTMKTKKAMKSRTTIHAHSQDVSRSRKRHAPPDSQNASKSLNHKHSTETHRPYGNKRPKADLLQGPLLSSTPNPKTQNTDDADSSSGEYSEYIESSESSEGEESEGYNN